MAAHVDPAAGVVRVNGRAWPFEVDPASGEAAVQVDGRPLRLRPLSWREKRNLARFVAGGPELLERMLLRASLAMGPGSEVSAREIPAADREGLLVLSRWLSSPGDPLLPLESLLLAQVGVEVAQQLHCSPLELDGWPAWEVEATWQVVRGRSAGEGEAPAEDDGLTRILVVPDEAADSEVAGPSAGGPSPPAPLPTHPPLPPGRGGPEALGHREDPDAALAALIASMPGFGDAAAWPGELPGLAAPSPLGWPEQPPPSLPPSSWPPTASGEDLEELFDLLAERLEEAAIDQGIDLEG